MSLATEAAKEGVSVEKMVALLIEYYRCELLKKRLTSSQKAAHQAERDKYEYCSCLEAAKNHNENCEAY
jgi:hypothetical protein